MLSTCFHYYLGVISYSQESGIANPDSSQSDRYYQLGESSIMKAEYGSAICYFEEAGAIFRSANDWDGYTMCLLKTSEVYSIKREFQTCEVFIKMAEDVIESNPANDFRTSVELLKNKGKFLLYKNDYHESIQELDKAIELASEHSEIQDISLIPVFNIIGINYAYLRNFEKAIENYKKALEIGIYNNLKNDKEIAKVYNNLGIAHKQLGDFNSALHFYLRNLAICELLLSKDNPELAKSYINIGVLYKNLGRYEEAMKYYNMAEDILVKIFNEDFVLLGSVYSKKATLFKNNGEYEKALLFFNRALNIYKGDLKVNYWRLITDSHNIGLVYYLIGEYDKAIEQLDQVIRIATEFKYPYLSNTYSLYAKCFESLNEYQKAEKYYNLAIGNRKEYYGVNHPELATHYLDLGKFYILIDRDQQGLELYEKALDIYLNNCGLRHPYTANAFASIGDCYLKWDKTFEALEYYQKALIAVTEDFNDPDIGSNPESIKCLSEIQILKILKKKAVALNQITVENCGDEDLYEFSRLCFSTYENIIHLIEYLRTQYNTRDSKLFISKVEQSTINEAIESAFRMYRLTGEDYYKEKCFEYTEKNKVSSLLSNLRNMEALRFSKVPDSLQILERALCKDIFFYKNQILLEKEKDEPDHNLIEAWDNNLFGLYHERDEIRTTLKSKYPEYYNLLFNHSVIDIATLQSKLKKHDVLIEYSISKNSLISSLITKENNEITINQLDSLFWEDLGLVYNFISTSRYGGISLEEYRLFQHSSFNLYKVLLSPYESIITEKNIIIVPDGELAFLPFEVLLTEPSDDSNFQYKDLPYLIKNHCVNYAYSATLLFEEFGNRNHTNREILAFAPSYENGTGRYAYGELTAGVENIREVLSPIVMNKQEVENISKFTKSKLFLDDLATKANFNSSYQDGYILHFALHTIIDAENPLNSQMVFAQDKTKNDDGILKTYELFNLSANAEMAVLSACKTGFGKVQKGEGIMSLAQGFKYAGVPSVVMTLWSVGDASSAYLMTDFYKSLSKGKGKDESLRLAKLNYLKQSSQIKSHPYYWAGYICVGNANPILKNQRGLYYFGSVALLLIIVFTGIFRIRKKFV